MMNNTDQTSRKNTNHLVTGTTGNVGSEVVKQLVYRPLRKTLLLVGN